MKECAAHEQTAGQLSSAERVLERGVFIDVVLVRLKGPDRRPAEGNRTVGFRTMNSAHRSDG